MNRYQKEVAQYNRRIPVYKYPVKFCLKESDRVKLKDEGKGFVASIKQFVNAMGGVSLTDNRKEFEVREDRLTDYYFYYDDPDETDDERKATILRAFNSGSTTVYHPLLKNLRKGIDYDLVIGEGEYIYKPRYRY
ncbi:hypothetical protein P7D31_00725 [Enterococcus dongliensis]|jgi:hypothetical protein|uniref:hypothetical protein n=1 Tax=Enterococcus TaxID=1350 RepID=UPI0028907C20|nr:hypothetical protein [Enterococcus dongliensis]MDT2638639.1 hypothetical protein [Enterococcus dongliensis]